MSGFDNPTAPWGLPGATAATRFAGGTSPSGAPVSGTFRVRDYVVAGDGVMWVCTVAGSPGTWVPQGSQTFTGDVTATGDITARFGASTQSKIGAVGPGGEAGLALGSAGDPRLYRFGAAVIATGNGTAFAAVGNGAVLYAELTTARQTQIGAAGPSSGYAGISMGGPGVDALFRLAAGQLATTTSLQIGETMTAPTFTGAALMISNAGVVPSTNPVGGGVIYADAGALKYRGTAGTVTTVAPA